MAAAVQPQSPTSLSHSFPASAASRLPPTLAKRPTIGDALSTTPSVSTSSAHPPLKLRDSCHACASSKVKCHKEKPTCSRCAKRGLKCEYFVTKRAGRKHDPNRHRGSTSSVDNVRRPSPPASGTINVAQPGIPVSSWASAPSIPAPAVSAAPVAPMSAAPATTQFFAPSPPPLNFPPLQHQTVVSSAPQLETVPVTTAASDPVFSQSLELPGTTATSESVFSGLLSPVDPAMFSDLHHDFDFLNSPLGMGGLGASMGNGAMGADGSGAGEDMLAGLLMADSNMQMFDDALSGHISDLSNLTGLNPQTPLQSTLATPRPPAQSPPNSRAPPSISDPGSTSISPSASCVSLHGTTCLVRALTLLKGLFPSTHSSCISTSASSNEHPNHPALRSTNPTNTNNLQTVIHENHATIEEVSKMLSCACANDGYLLAILCLVVFRILGGYESAISGAAFHSFNRPSGSASDSGFEDDTAMVNSNNGNSNPLNDPLQNSPETVTFFGASAAMGGNAKDHRPLAYHIRAANVQNQHWTRKCLHPEDEDELRMAAQCVLSELHRVQRVVNLLGEKLKLPARRSSASPASAPSVGSIFSNSTSSMETNGYNASRSASVTSTGGQPFGGMGMGMGGFGFGASGEPFSERMMEELERDLRRRLKGLFSEIVGLLRRD